MSDTPKKKTGRTRPLEKFWNVVPRMSPEEERRMRWELGGTRIRLIPTKDLPKRIDKS